MPTASSRHAASHILALDGLRGLAIIAVILCHVNHRFGGPFSQGVVDRPVAMVFAGGWVGVDLFFVLSGFLITGILYEAKGCAGYFRNFYARRVLRIMPLYYGFLAVVVAAQLWGWHEYVWFSRDGLLSLVTYTYNLRVALGGDMIAGMHHFWSLAIEEHFYLLWPLVVVALSRRFLMHACLALGAISFLSRVAVVASGAWPLTAFFFTPCRLDGLLAGSWVALAYKDQADWERLRRWATPTLWMAGGVLLAIGLGQGHFLPDADPTRMPDAAVDGRFVITIGVAALAVCFAALIVLTLHAAEGSRLRRFSENMGLRAIGKYSYAMYVFHVLILFLTVRLFAVPASLPSFVVKSVMAVWIVAASFVAAWISYHLYEKHFLRLKRHFEFHPPVHADLLVPVPSHPLSNA
ncbi:MAG: acyltransferase [Planctomycetia bacterium]|nr:acyltransferase [Planctomycetia bacterium]